MTDKETIKFALVQHVLDSLPVLIVCHECAADLILSSIGKLEEVDRQTDRQTQTESVG